MVITLVAVKRLSLKLNTKTKFRAAKRPFEKEAYIASKTVVKLK